MVRLLVRFHHVAFRTKDLAALEDFYTRVLGLTVTKRSDGYSVWLDAGGVILMLERRDEDEPDVPPGSKELVAFALSPSSGMSERLAAAGVAIEARTTFTLYVRDPDGRRIGLSSYPNELE
jgi:catechol 2,3-dioxygenase-like lactoylglutathione lyase family enzyme